MKRNSNKGFSLVELIVVVLIMAIIAVVLAPQVTKWVRNSRQSSDLQLMDSAKDFSQLALTNSAAAAAADNAGGIDIIIDRNSCVLKSKTSGKSIESFATKFAEYAGISDTEIAACANADKSEYTIGSIKTKDNESVLEIKIDGGEVAASANIGNDDLEVSATNSGTPGSNPTSTPSGTPTGDPTPEAKSVSISDASVEEGGTATITATIKGYSSEPELEWVSKNTDVVTVAGTSKTATLTAKGSKGATAVIEVSVKNEATVKSSCTVTIVEAGEYTITLTQKTATITTSETIKLSATVTPDSAKNRVVWSIRAGDEQYASVSNDGLVTPIKAGTAHVSCKISGIDKTVEDVATITITNPIPQQITVIHQFKEGQNKTKIYEETVNRNGSTFTSTFTFDNLTTSSTKTFNGTESEFVVVWEKKNGSSESGVSFGNAIYILRKDLKKGRTKDNSYNETQSAKSIKLDKNDYPVFNDGYTPNNKLVYYCDEFESGGLYVDSTVTSNGYTYHVLVEWKASHGTGGEWVWSTTGATKKVYIKP